MMKGHKTRERINEHWALFHKLWNAFEKIAAVAIAQGMPVFIEWPRRCTYWQDNKFRAFMRKHKGTDALFDGCAYGLTSRSGYPIQKPWRVHCINSCLPELLYKRCRGDHDHEWAQGSETLRTQHYPKAVVEIVHRAIRKDLEWKDFTPLAMLARTGDNDQVEPESDSDVSVCCPPCSKVVTRRPSLHQLQPSTTRLLVPLPQRITPLEESFR